MNENSEENRFKRHLMGYLADTGARSLKLSSAQQMKLQEWIVPYLRDELELGGGPVNIVEIRKYIDRWESNDLNEEDYKHYYTKKDGEGKAAYWDWNIPTLIPVLIGVGFLLWFWLK